MHRDMTICTLDDVPSEWLNRGKKRKKENSKEGRWK
jgi:hypothetical protein